MNSTDWPLMGVLTLSLVIPVRLYTLPYWSNTPFLIFDIWALCRSGMSARVPKCQKLKMVGYISMALNPLNSSNLEQLALKGSIHISIHSSCVSVSAPLPVTFCDLQQSFQLVLNLPRSSVFWKQCAPITIQFIANWSCTDYHFI